MFQGFKSLKNKIKYFDLKITYITLRKNKTCIPSNFLRQRHREPETNIFGFRKNMSLVSYVPKKNQSVILLSTMHNNNNTDINNKNKSEISIYYNKTKGEVLSLLTVGGVGLVQQVQSLIIIIQDAVTRLPDFGNQISCWQL